MNRILIDVCVEDGNVVQVIDTPIKLDDDFNVVVENTPSFRASKNFIVDHYRVRSLSGRQLCVMDEPSKISIKEGSIVYLTYKGGRVFTFNQDQKQINAFLNKRASQ